MNKLKIKAYFNKFPGNWIAWPFRFVWNNRGVIIGILIVCLMAYGIYRAGVWGLNWWNKPNPIEQEIAARAKELGYDQPSKVTPVPAAPPTPKSQKIVSAPGGQPTAEAPAPAPVPVTPAPTATPSVRPVITNTVPPVQAPVAQKPMPRAPAENPVMNPPQATKPVTIKVTVRPITQRNTKPNHSTRLFRDVDGQFITPPNYYMWWVDEDTGKGQWFEPFSDWENIHYNEALLIRAKYADQPVLYLNYEHIVRDHPEAKIPGS